LEFSGDDAGMQGKIKAGKAVSLEDARDLTNEKIIVVGASKDPTVGGHVSAGLKVRLAKPAKLDMPAPGVIVMSSLGATRVFFLSSPLIYGL
jgi:hypothetical protein